MIDVISKSGTHYIPSKQRKAAIPFLVFCSSFVMMFMLIGEARWDFAEESRNAIEDYTKEQRNSIRQYNIGFRERVRNMEQFMIQYQGYDPNTFTKEDHD